MGSPPKIRQKGEVTCSWTHTEYTTVCGPPCDLPYCPLPWPDPHVTCCTAFSSRAYCPTRPMGDTMLRVTLRSYLRGIFKMPWKHTGGNISACICERRQYIYRNTGLYALLNNLSVFREQFLQSLDTFLVVFFWICNHPPYHFFFPS